MSVSLLRKRVVKRGPRFRGQVRPRSRHERGPWLGFGEPIPDLTELVSPGRDFDRAVRSTNAGNETNNRLDSSDLGPSWIRELDL